jgi:hypothetical protein
MQNVSEPRNKLELEGFNNESMRKHVLQAMAVFGRNHAASMITANLPGYLKVYALQLSL